MEIILKKVSEIKPDPNQPRKEFKKEDLKIFGDSQKSIGQINPIEIDEKNMIVTGETRWRAAKEVGMKEIKCIVLTGLNKEERLTRQLAENMARKSLSIVEQREAIKQLIKFSTKLDRSPKQSSEYHSKGYKEISEKIGCSQGWITQIMEIDKASKPIKKAVDDGKLSVSTAHEIMKLPEADQDQYAKKVIDNQIDHRTIRDEVKQLNESEPEVKQAILDDEITPDQAESISKLKTPEQREKAISEHKGLKVIDKGIERSIEYAESAKGKKELDKKLLQANNWIASFRGSVTDSRKELEKTLKILLISTQFIPVMDDKQKKNLDIQLDRFLELLERAVRIAEQIKDKI